jgi:hypothetical protein
MDQLEIIHRANLEHHKIRGHLLMVGDSVNDVEAFVGLQNAQANLGQSPIQDLYNHIDKLKQTVAQMNEGLQNHFGFEEKWLPAVLGENLMKALVLEHNEIRASLAKCTTALNEDAGSLSREKLLAYRTSVQSMTEELLNLIENHAHKEEMILQMIEKVLVQERGTGEVKK